MALYFACLLISFFFYSNTQHCVSDVQKLDKTQLQWSNSSKPPLWIRYPNSSIYHSICLDSFLDDMFDSPLNELTNVTIRQIFDAYTANNCILYIHGGLIRDILEGDPSHDIDVEFTCDNHLALKICQNLLGNTEMQFNVSLCYTNDFGYLFIGRRNIDTGIEGKLMQESMFNIENQEYTPNMLYYELKNRVIFDLGTGVEDIKHHQIKIPVTPELRDLWLYGSNATIGLPDSPLLLKWFVLKKVCRYWKLKVLGYIDYESDKTFLVEKINELWDSPNYPMKYIFNIFLCEALGGRFIVPNMNCTYKFAIPDEKSEFCIKYMHELYLDLHSLQNGKIYFEINEMVAYTKCHIFHNKISQGLGNFSGKLETLGINLIIILIAIIIANIKN